LAWTRPIDPRPDNRARERDWMILSLGLQVFNQRLDDMRLSANPPFLRAYASFQQLGRSAQMTALGLSTTEQGWRGGLEQALKAWHTLLANGVTQAELERELTNWRSRLENEAAAASTRRSSPLADELVGSLDSDTVFVSPASDLALFNALSPAASVTAVDAALRKAFTGNGPLVFLGGPQPMEGAEQILADAARVATEPQQADQSGGEKWPYSTFGAPGEIAERHEEADLGATLLRFANGVRLTVKPTNFQADQILVSVNIGHGREDLAPNGSAPIWAVNSGAFLLGGYKELAIPELKRLMAGKQVGVAMSLADNGLRLSGATRPQDLSVQMQMMAAYLTDPGWRPEGLELVRSQLINAFPQWQTSPGGVYSHHAAQMLRGGDPRWHSPDLAEVQAFRYDALRELLEPVLQKAPIEIAMVGDITVERAIAEVAATFGALPARDAETPALEVNRRISFPDATPEPIILRHKGRKDQGLAVAVWPTTDGLADRHAPRILRVLQLILQQRLTDQFRTKLGDSYSPASDMESSLDFPGYGFILALAETPEAKMSAFDETVAGIARDLRDTEVSADEFERARKPRIETLLKSRQTNEYWLGTLQRAQTQPIWLELVRNTISDLQRVTPAEVRRLAETYLRDDRLWRLRVVPEPDRMNNEGEKG
jgi:zinc protease